MSDMVMIGPLALSTGRLLAVVGILAFLMLGAWVGRRMGRPVEGVLWLALTVGVVAARAAFVLTHWADYAATPAAIFSVGDGGFMLWPGVLAAMAALAIGLRSVRRAMPLMAVAGGVGFAVSVIQLLVIASPPVPLPQGVMLQRLDGQAVPLDRYRGRPFVINLWATWCGPCRRELPMLIAEAATTDVPILLVDQGEGSHKVSSFLAQERLSDAHVLLDNPQRLMAAMGTRALPTTLFVNARGEVVLTWTGEISRAALRDGIRQIEAP